MMRTVVVLAAIAAALALGIFGGASDSRVLVGALAIAFVPALLAAWWVLERFVGRDLWHFSAPYPYRSMRERGETAAPRPREIRKRVSSRRESRDRRAFPRAA